MPEKPQSFAHHTRWDPWFHFFMGPVFIVAVIFALIHLFAHIASGGLMFNIHSVLILIFASACLVAVFKIRLYPLKVQDRVIRLEEQLRLTRLLSEPLRSRIPELTVDQLCALRFASDAELPALAARALHEKLSRKQIKEAIQNWRPDYWRV